MRHLGLAAVLAVACAAAAHAQFGRGFFGSRVATDRDFDGRFHYCRLVYRPAMNGWGGSWRTDYPMADINLSVRLSELTKIRVSRNNAGAPNHLLVRPGGDELFQCPLVIMSAPGSAFLDNEEADRLRQYLEKGGFLWTDDSWGTYQWQHWVRELRKVLPADEYPIVDLPLEHELFRTQFEVTEIPQIPNIGFFLRSGGRTSEQGADSAVPQVKGIVDREGRLMVLMTHNTDIADSWEREGEDPSYFYAFSPRGYAFGINAVLYALTH
ncbi:MAG: DUF4159 domain-containing protein [Acidobacteria bacterium]|nr:DUF4159 domain-containing protein [Acidobacteriota bacterium]